MAAVKFPTFPNIDFTRLEFPTLPKFDLPKFDQAKFDQAKADLPKFDTGAVAGVAKDATYMTIGLGALAFQKAQVRGREIAKTVSDQFGTGKAQIDEVVDAIEARLATLDSRFVALEGKLDTAVEDLEKRLPERAGALLGKSHQAAKSARKQVRGLIVNAG